MSALTTRQRDVLRLLLDANSPLATAAVAQQLQLTPRQVNYSLKGVQRWLTQHDVTLSVTPGVGAQLVTTDEKSNLLVETLKSDNSYQLVLDPAQRQQLFLFYLLTTDDPVILYQLQQQSQVSRTTILKDLDSAETWLARFRLTLDRRPNYGFEIVGTERSQRQALVALLWGDTEFTDSLWHMTHTEGLLFTLNADAPLLPLLDQVKTVVDSIKVRSAVTRVAQAEADLGGRFSDAAVLLLALVLAVQRYRVTHGQWLEENSAEMSQLRNHPIWSTASRIIPKKLRQDQPELSRQEIAFVAAHLLSSTRNDRWPGDVDSETDFEALITQLMSTISASYRLPDLLQDATLRDGLAAHIIPACLRQKFGVWSPQQHGMRLDKSYAFELAIADTLSEIVAKETGTKLPVYEVNNLSLLIRAAYVRERPNQLQRVIVVCPSGMATAQLLTARLKARFPRLGSIEVVSMRGLSAEGVDSAELILTTVPLPETVVGNIKVIQVHPLLLPEDIETITQWLE